MTNSTASNLSLSTTTVEVEVVSTDLTLNNFPHVEVQVGGSYEEVEMESAEPSSLSKYGEICDLMYANQNYNLLSAQFTAILLSKADKESKKEIVIDLYKRVCDNSNLCQEDSVKELYKGLKGRMVYMYSYLN